MSPQLVTIYHTLADRAAEDRFASDIAFDDTPSFLTAVAAIHVAAVAAAAAGTVAADAAAAGDGAARRPRQLDAAVVASESICHRALRTGAEAAATDEGWGDKRPANDNRQQGIC